MVGGAPSLIRVERCEGVLLRLLYYPSGHGDCSRVGELRGLGVTQLVLRGPTQIPRGIHILGKGSTSLVVEGLMGGRRVAVKVRRLDARRPSLKPEAGLLRLANKVGVGPRLYAYSDNFIVMELVEGIPIGRFLLIADRESLRKVLRSLLDQCFRLDLVGLDHGELPNARRHVYVVGGRPVIVDFESASLSRTPSNLTSIVAYILLGSSRHAMRVSALLNVDRERLIKLLRKYKQVRDKDAYLDVVAVILGEADGLPPR